MTGPAQYAQPLRTALREITAGHGATVLGDRAAFGALLADFLPDNPQLRRILLHTVSAETAASLSGYAREGMDAGTAIRLAAATLRERTLIDEGYCQLVAAEIAVALHYPGASGGVALISAGQPAGRATGGGSPAIDVALENPPRAPATRKRGLDGPARERRPRAHRHRAPTRAPAALRGHALRVAAALIVVAIVITIVILLAAAAPSNHRPTRGATFPAQHAPLSCRSKAPCLSPVSSKWGSPTALAVDASTLYIATNQGFVVAVRRNSATPISVGPDPVALALSPDRRILCVHNADGSVSVIDTATNSVKYTVKVKGSHGPLTFAPDGKTFYASDGITGGVTPVSVGTGTQGVRIRAGVTPYALASAGGLLYVSNVFGDTVTPVDMSSGEPHRPIKVGYAPLQLVLSPDGRTLYVYCGEDGKVWFISTATGHVTRTVYVGKSLDALAVSHDGRILYMANNLGSSVSVISTVTGRSLTPIPVGSHPDLLAITPDGSTLYVANAGSSAVTVIPLTGARRA